MENQDERTNRKMFAAMAVAAMIIIAAFVAYYMGLIPGIGQGNKVAEELQAKVVAAKGPNLKNEFMAYATSNPRMTEEQKDMLKNVTDGIDLDFQFSGTKPSSADGKGTVEIDAPKLVANVKSDGAAAQSGQISAPKLFISRDVADKNHFYYHTEGGIDFSANMNGAMSKVFTISGKQPFNEVKYNADGYTGYFKSDSKNVKVIEGRGNTVLATIGESSFEANSNFSTDKIDSWGKIAEKNIVPGDMIKIMLGDIQPVSIDFDYAYKGDDYRPALQSLKDFQKRTNDEKIKAQLDPNYKVQDIAPEVKPFDGNLKVNDISVMMGNAGLALNANLNFKKSNSKVLPFGEVDFKIAQYQKLIDYFSRFLKVPKEQVDRTVQMASDVGTNANGDISFVISFDGTANVKVNGKTEDELKAVLAKYMVPAQPQAEAPVAAPPAAVSSKPIK